MTLRVEMGYNEKKNSKDFILERLQNESTAYMMSALSKGFNHYIQQATDRDIKFKNLRKTYLIHLAIALGDKVKLFSGHGSEEVLKNHYISSAYMAGNLNNFSIF